MFCAFTCAAQCSGAKKYWAECGKVGKCCDAHRSVRPRRRAPVMYEAVVIGSDIDCREFLLGIAVQIASQMCDLVMRLENSRATAHWSDRLLHDYISRNRHSRSSALVIGIPLQRLRSGVKRVRSQSLCQRWRTLVVLVASQAPDPSQTLRCNPRRDRTERSHRKKRAGLLAPYHAH